MSYIWLIILFPLFGFLVNGLLGKRLPEKVVGWLGSSMILGSFLVSVTAYIQSRGQDFEAVELRLFRWLNVGNFQVDFAFLIDPLSLLMILTVTGVAFLIHVYSIGYMHGDPGFGRYFSYLNLFTFMMLILVLANNFPLMFIGWEGVGLCSYLLIGFWYEDEEKANAGMKAFVVNRIGDFGFILAMLLMFVNFKSLHFSTVFERAEMFSGGGVITIITLLLFLGATGKSAQIPLYVWLPDAMAGPTPVSALIHAATMVTAGVYMIARTSYLYVLSPDAMMVVAIVGVVTAFFAATIAITQNDIKKVLAYSTVSQLGYMFTAVGVGAFAAGIFHLMTHAFFKSLLFLGAGSVIHAMSNEQDMRYMGGLKQKMPITFWTMLIATCAIAGVPLFSGFFSKDEILWEAYSSLAGGTGIWLIGAVAAIITAFYMFRLIFLTFYGKARWKEGIHPHESPPVMTVPLIILAILSVFGGYVGVPHVLGGENRIREFLAPAVAELHNPIQSLHHSASEELTLMVVSILFAFGGIILAIYLYLKRPNLPARIAGNFRTLYRLLLNKYFVDEFYLAYVVKPIHRFAILLWKKFDMLVVDGAVNGTGRLSLLLGGFFRRFQTGLVQNYAAVVFLGIVVIILYYIFRY